MADNPFTEQNQDNPFDEPGDAGAGASSSAAGASAAGGAGSSAPASGGGASANAFAKAPTGDEMALQAEVLRMKEEELKQKAEALQRKEEYITMMEKLALGDRPPNWPWCKPVIHHDIKKEMPEAVKGTMQFLYYLWIATCFSYFWNMVCVLVAVFTKDVDAEALPAALSVIYFFVCPPAAAYFWYFPAYKGARKAQSSMFVIHFISFGVHILVAIFLGLGIVSGGGGGLILGIAFFDKDEVGGGVICLINAFFWFVEAICGIYLIYKTYGYYSSAGMSMEKAKREAALEAARSSV